MIEQRAAVAPIDWRAAESPKVTDGTNTVDVGVVKVTPPNIRTHAGGKWRDNLLALPKY